MGHDGDPLDRGRAALRVGDADAARSAFAGIDPPTGDSLEGLAQAAFIAREFDEAIRRWEQAYAAHRAAGDGAGAVRAARNLGCVHGSVRGDWAVANGWIARASRLLPATDAGSEPGWIALTRGMFEGDRAVKDRCFEQARSVAMVCDDTTLLAGSLAYLGASLVHEGRTEEGMVHLDEALAAVLGEEVGDLIVIEEIFCQLFSACEHAQDVDRADQWLRAGDALARRRNLPAVAAYCHTHFGGVLTAAGRWDEAEATLTEALRLWVLGQRTLRTGALARLAGLRVRQGRLDEAEQLLDGLPLDWETSRPWAELLLAQGRVDRACELLERTLAGADPAAPAAIPLRTLLVDAHLAKGDTASAAAALDGLAEDPGTPYLRALVALARGRVAAAQGDPAAERFLLDAVDGFTRAGLPLESARSHLVLADACRSVRPELALAAARTALDGFERLRAARYVDAAVSLLRSLGVRVAPVREGLGRLSGREAEVFALMAEGLSNPEIADRLVISRKTVEHHVGHVLAKLGLRTRAEAAAYAVKHGPAQERPAPRREGSALE
jgi:DNA-binding CsgD family transcriptional regulator